MKPYQQIPIEECGEPLVSIPLEKFSVQLPHPYVELGAEYGNKSPYCLRQGVVNGLLKAQFILNKRYPDWKLKIYDAYRPVGVQQFMVDYSFGSLLRQRYSNQQKVSAQQRQDLWEQVYKIWAAPSLDIATPPPHSTGAAIDLTIVDESGNAIDMGGEIDEMSERANPEYYLGTRESQKQQYHLNRQLLNRVMNYGGFTRHPGEWWHFSCGDQMWAWIKNQENPHIFPVARYGRV